MLGVMWRPCGPREVGCLWPECLPANLPDLIGIAPIFELQNLKRKRKTFYLGNKVGIFRIYIFLLEL